jgi:ferric iron reductase protein FhuF
MGHSFNQLAVVVIKSRRIVLLLLLLLSPVQSTEKASSSRRRAWRNVGLALYWYCRSLQAAVEQFVTKQDQFGTLVCR